MKLFRSLTLCRHVESKKIDFRSFSFISSHIEALPGHESYRYVNGMSDDDMLSASGIREVMKIATALESQGIMEQRSIASNDIILD